MRLFCGWLHRGVQYQKPVVKGSRRSRARPTTSTSIDRHVEESWGVRLILMTSLEPTVPILGSTSMTR